MKYAAAILMILSSFVCVPALVILGMMMAFTAPTSLRSGEPFLMFLWLAAMMGVLFGGAVGGWAFWFAERHRLSAACSGTSLVLGTLLLVPAASW